MNNRGKINWAIWIAVFSAIYCSLYELTIGPYTSMEVCPGEQIVYATFTSLPIFFLAGAKREDFFTYIGSNVVGVLWGMGYLMAMGYLSSIGVPWWINIGIVILFAVAIECGIHFCLPASIPFNEVPAQFGAICCVFWCSALSKSILGPGEGAIGGFYNFTFVPVLTLTLCFGVILGVICSEGLRLINQETGKWRWPPASHKEMMEK